MKGLFKFIGGLCVLLFAAVCMTGCDKLQPQPATVDIEQLYEPVQDLLEDFVNPEFTYPEEVKLFQQNLIESKAVDDIFISMPYEVLRNVTQVCLKRDSAITKWDIVEEYQANRAVYDALVPAELPAPAPEQSNTPTATEEQQKPAPSSVSYHYELDTVNGKSCPVLVKEERYESY